MIEAQMLVDHPLSRVPVENIARESAIAQQITNNKCYVCKTGSNGGLLIGFQECRPTFITVSRMAMKYVPHRQTLKNRQRLGWIRRTWKWW